MGQYRTERFETESVTGRHWVAVGLVAITGILHVYPGIAEAKPPLVLAGAGFFGAILLFLANYRRRQLYLVGIVYTAVQIPLWYVIKAGEYTTIGYVDKAVQLVLVILLAYLYWSTRSSTRHESGSTAD